MGVLILSSFILSFILLLIGRPTAGVNAMLVSTEFPL
jgi:hypothetical protein